LIIVYRTHCISFVSSFIQLCLYSPVRWFLLPSSLSPVFLLPFSSSLYVCFDFLYLSFWDLHQHIRWIKVAPDALLPLVTSLFTFFIWDFSFFHLYIFLGNFFITQCHLSLFTNFRFFCCKFACIVLSSFSSFIFFSLLFYTLLVGYSLLNRRYSYLFISRYFYLFFRCFQPPSLYSCLSWLSVFISFWLLFFSYHTLLASRLAYSFWNSFLFFAGTLISMLFYLIFLKPLFLSYCHMFFLLFLRFIVVTSGFRVLMLSGDLLIFFVTAILRLACFLYTLTYFSFFFFFYIFILISYFIFL